MAKGRKRKAGKREPNGRPQRPDAATRREADRVDPTPEMARKKRATGGGEIGDPLTCLPLTDPQREALSLYFSRRRAAGWGVRRITAQYDDPMFLGGEEAESEERERRNKALYEACDKALLGAGKDAHRAVANLFSFRCLTGSVSDLIAGANALMAHFGIAQERAA